MDFWKFLEDFMSFLSGSHPKAVEVNHRLERLWTVAGYNALFIPYLLLCLSVFLIITAPFFIASESPRYRGVGMTVSIISGVANFCHQIPYRSFVFDGVPQPVCSRDVGIYSGALLGLATIFLGNPPKILSQKRILLIAFAPIVLDGFTQTVFALRESNNILRFATGIIFTFGVFAFFTQRLLNPRLPILRENILSRNTLIFDLILVFLVFSLFATMLEPFGKRLMSKNRAIELAQTPQFSGPAKAYYIPTNAPLSIRFDPFFGRHKTPIFEDLYGMEWVDDYLRQRVFLANHSISLMEGGEQPQAFDFTDGFFRHRLGIWAVTVESGGNTRYVYFDAYTGEVLAETIR
ncbi:MAG TPA: DUF2085 domain-containing protein [Candidatus Altiarchaeales archaeon]|nr:DUF2085 domain-containing protein [Candidatus Altiarchaeales archaeon]